MDNVTLDAVRHISDSENGEYAYEVDGNYGDYTVEVEIDKDIAASCDCPYPGEGCKHVVLVLLDLLDRNEVITPPKQLEITKDSSFLSPKEIRTQVLDDLPEQVTNNYYLDLHEKQAEIHAGYSKSLLPLLNKKFLTPMDLRKIQILLLKMRQVCDSTYLIDRESNISPKLAELATILDELVLENKRKVVIFSEWTTMTFLIGKHLSKVGEEQVPSPPTSSVPEQSPEKMEAVLNQGMSFISGLLEMATGQKLEASGKGEEKLVTLDKETGEVTLKFKLPGF